MHEEPTPYASPADDELPTTNVASGLAISALILPLLSGTALFFVTALIPSLVLSGATVIVTAVLLAVDAFRLGRTDPTGRQPESPGFLFVAMLLLWIVAYPLAFFRRSRFGGPPLGFPAIGVAIYFAVGPLVVALIQPAFLPSCTDPMVVDLVEQSLRGTPVGRNIESIDSHHEVRYDAENQVRYGTCAVRTKDKMFELGYRVEWEDRQTGRFIVKCDPLPLILPLADSPEVVEVLAGVLGNSEIGPSVKSIEGHEQLRYDEEHDVRYCQCTVNTDDGPQVVRYVVEWLDRATAYFGVRVPPAELPTCTDPEVVKVLDQVIRSAPLGPYVRSIEGHRELSYDSQANIRRGECIVRLPDENVRVVYIVEWRDQERGLFQVRTLEQ